MIKDITKIDVKLPSREFVTNKGDAGRVLVVGGNIGMCGAAAFATLSAYRMGCGLVRAHVHPENRIPMQTLVPESVISFWEEDEFGYIDECLCWADAVLVGVGLGKGEYQKRVLKRILSNCKVPLVLDADALNIISEHPFLLSKLPETTVLTPHMAELSRLTGVSVCDIKKDVFSLLEKHFKDTGACVIAKDSTTSVFMPDNKKYTCSLGDSSLSTAGTGDVLAGIIVSLLAQKMSLSDAVVSALYIHGTAGKSAGERLSQYSVMARDVIDEIPKIIKEI